MSRLIDSSESTSGKTDPALRLSHTFTVLGVALVMRALVVWTVLRHYPKGWLFTRGMEMGLLAKSLLAGEGLSSPFGQPTGPTAFIAPVYPILVAAVFKVFGEFSTTSAVVIMFAQAALNLLTIWLIMRIARRLFNQAAATVAGLIWACSFPLVWMPTIFWETSLSCCLLAGLFTLVLKYRDLDDLTPVHWMSLGAYCGFAALVNPALLLSLLAISLWLVIQTRRDANSEARVWWPAISVLTFVLVFSPWPIRNANTFHAFIPLRTTVGFELWMGNHEGSTGYLDESLFPTFNQAELADYRARGEVAYSAHKSELAKRYVVAHPARFAGLTARRIVRFWAGAGTKNGSILFAMHGVFTTLLGFAGLWLLFRSRRFATLALFTIPLLLFPLPYVITHAEFRYRLVIDPVLTIFAGYAVTEIAKLFARSSAKPVVTSSLPYKSALAANNSAAWNSTQCR